MSTASNGRAREYRVRDALERAGWERIMRAAASKGSADLFMGKAGHVPVLVQVGTAKSKTLGPGDRARFVHHAQLARALPILARTQPGVGIKYHVAELTPESTWTEWTP